MTNQVEEHCALEIRLERFTIEQGYLRQVGEAAWRPSDPRLSGTAAQGHSRRVKPTFIYRVWVEPACVHLHPVYRRITVSSPSRRETFDPRYMSDLQKRLVGFLPVHLYQM